MLRSTRPIISVHDGGRNLKSFISNKLAGDNHEYKGKLLRRCSRAKDRIFKLGQDAILKMKCFQ
jgi:hypothetical protein